MPVYTMHNMRFARKDSKKPARCKETRWVNKNFPTRLMRGAQERKQTRLEFIRFYRWYASRNGDFFGHRKVQS